jgi:hypothetical protein
VTFLLALLVGSEPCNNLIDPNEIPLPSSRGLWEARGTWEWKSEYNKSQAESLGGTARVQNVSEFAIAKRGGTEAVIAGSSNRIEDAIVDWYADVDGLGMVFAAVLAGV